jgi:undecaprenyl-diphosphatase
MSLIDSIKKLDTAVFLFFNSMHNSSMDVIMEWASAKFVWVPLYVFLLYLVFKFVGKNTWLVVIAVIIVILLSDQLSVHLFKNVFLRYRPCHNLELQSLVHVNGNCGGQYGFISSHAANTFALAMFLTLFFKNKIRFFGVYIFAWAFFVSYSRIYNGVHYPADVAVGAIVGMILGWFVFRLYQFVYRRLNLNNAPEPK